MPRLIVKFGASTKAVPLGEEAVTFGRTPENTVPLDDVGVSRKHAQILFVGKGWEVVDLGSRNGTKVNGKKVPRAMLKAGDTIEMGPATVVFEDGEAGPEASGDGGLEIEELDLGGGDAGGGGGGGGRSASANIPTGAFPAVAGAGGGGGPTGECKLKIISGEKQGTEIPLKAARTTFGRRSTNTVTITNDPAVSGVHCEITREPNGYVLRDLGSTNGTLVDGEPVVEAMLRHNSRLRIGAQRMVFVDPSVADIESALATGDDGGEWGLMRGEVDVEGGGRRGGGGSLVFAGVVVAAVAGGAFFIVKTAPKSNEVPGVKDNRVSDFSFEEGVVRWFAPGEEETATARIAGTPEKPMGASGVHCLEVVPSGSAEGGAPAVVEFRTGAAEASDASVTPDAPYEISAKVGSGTGAVVVTWLSSSRPGLVREVSSPPVEGGSAWPVTKAVVTAPAHATAFSVRLAAFGGTASFDDVVFRRADGGAAPELVLSDLRIRIDASGGFEAVRGGEVLLTQGGVAPSADAAPETLLGASLASGPTLSGNSLAAAGTLRGGPAFEMKADGIAAGAKLTAVPRGGAGALTFTCPAGLVRGAVTLVLEKSAKVVPEADTSREEGVRKVIVGTADGPKPFVLSADPRSPGFTFTSRRTPRGLRIQLAPPEKAPEGVDAASVDLSVDLSLEEKAAEGLMRRAQDLSGEGRLGEAAKAFDEVTIIYHYLPPFRGPAATRRDEILSTASGQLETAKKSAGSAKRFHDDASLERVIEEAKVLAKSFEGHAIGDGAKELLSKAAADLQAMRLEGAETRIEALYLRGKDLEKSDQLSLAVAIYAEVVRTAPEGSEYRGAAVAALPVLQEKLKILEQARFGTRK